MSQYDFVVNVFMTIHNSFISHDLVNKLLIAKMSLAKTLILFNAKIHKRVRR